MKIDDLMPYNLDSMSLSREQVAILENSRRIIDLENKIDALMRSLELKLEDCCDG